MKLIVLGTLASAATLVAGCVHREPLAELPMAQFEHPPSVLQARDSRMPDGKTVFAMADINTTTAANRALQTYQAPRQEYPSVGGNILRGVSDPASN